MRPGGSRSAVETPVEVPLPAGGALYGDLGTVEEALGTVVFAHGSGSSRHSSRNRHVAAALRRRGLNTLLMDLLTEKEEAVDRHTGHLRFDIDLLAERLGLAARWLAADPALRSLPVGYFGASTGAAAALVAAAGGNPDIRAIVSRGGRPDLAGDALASVTAPTLLIVGGADEPVIGLNRLAQRKLSGPSELVIVPGATHLFEETGALDEVARLAGGWFASHLAGPAPTPEHTPQ